MMTIKQIEVTVGEITKGYVNNDEQGVRGYDGRLDIRPPYQREFIYNEKEQQAVITTVLNDYPLNVMYWVRRADDADCPYEVMDGQQRTLSLCEYVGGEVRLRVQELLQPACGHPAADTRLQADGVRLRRRVKRRNWSGSRLSTSRASRSTTRKLTTPFMPDHSSATLSATSRSRTAAPTGWARIWSTAHPSDRTS